MEHLPKKTCQNGISYTLVGDYYIPDLQLPEESRPIGIWGRMHKDYLEQYHPAQYNDLVLTGKLWTYLADLNEQAQERLESIIQQMKNVEGVTEELKACDQIDLQTILVHGKGNKDRYVGGNCPSRTNL